ncbi:hypothetical protein CXB77_08370 [Chromatium okenii]|uniref:histidine kinase n=1 Tax=Chromatium okenii TaxID=61644 RepID=A0A2S7XR65_9GAMM|nr:ATP-binding protein [Chromatium okenii]PQJ95891.1 hypothetical protein CXB77_08370 [Chromatium okenii]
MPPLPLHIYTDPTRARQIIFNLLSNAIKFTDVGAVRLIISFISEQELLAISVQDTGCGIEDEHIEALFEPLRKQSVPPRGVLVALAWGCRFPKNWRNNLAAKFRSPAQSMLVRIYCHAGNWTD